MENSFLSRPSQQSFDGDAPPEDSRSSKCSAFRDTVWTVSSFFHVNLDCFSYHRLGHSSAVEDHHFIMADSQPLDLTHVLTTLPDKPPSDLRETILAFLQDSKSKIPILVALDDDPTGKLRSGIA